MGFLTFRGMRDIMGKSIGRLDLQVGQWVKFSTKTDLGSLSEGQQQIYQNTRIFLVVAREDAMFDSCRCYLIDENGKSYHYCPKKHSLGYVDLLWDNNNICAFSDEEIECVLGKETMLSVYQAAKAQLEKMSDYFSKHPAKKLNVDAKLEDKEVIASTLSTNI
jgi:hypothetical protein